MNKNEGKVFGWALLLITVGIFCLQMGSLFVQARYDASYVDDRLFYILNMVIVICLMLSIWFLLKPTKKIAISFTIIFALFVIANGILLVNRMEDTKNILSVSPDWQHVLSIKQDGQAKEAVYYRSYYGILARPKERLSYKIDGEYQVEWLAKDVAAFTYKATDQSIQQFIATYGDRGSGRSYYYVGGQTHGVWQAKDTKVINNQEGISITHNGETEVFEWEHIEQFGTLAIVLKKDHEAAWTIALKENFEVHADASKKTVGNIVLYKASLEESEPILLEYQGEYE
ncbi:hypothetical protein GLV94_01315 [Virgibacillus halodenitrificans]|uniref:hypothetical protein n=1 Tax=Virgibacillus halodenitrificans TaxID=1482 RepID=UPI001369670C|nr:hypothetical protein [Virgibacillus halodenitrificans]MYL44274.1 hypothetical protein [Virgibacillus halodenitrificans]